MLLAEDPQLSAVSISAGSDVLNRLPAKQFVLAGGADPETTFALCWSGRFVVVNDEVASKYSIALRGKLLVVLGVRSHADAVAAPDGVNFEKTSAGVRTLIADRIEHSDGVRDDVVAGLTSSDVDP